MFCKNKFSKNDEFLVLIIQKTVLNALNLIYCEFHINQICIVEDMGKIMKRAFEDFSSVYVNGQ